MVHGQYIRSAITCRASVQQNGSFRLIPGSWRLLDRRLSNCKYREISSSLLLVVVLLPLKISYSAAHHRPRVPFPNLVYTACTMKSNTEINFFVFRFRSHFPEGMMKYQISHRFRTQFATQVPTHPWALISSYTYKAVAWCRSTNRLC